MLPIDLFTFIILIFTFDVQWIFKMSGKYLIVSDVLSGVLKISYFNPCLNFHLPLGGQEGGGGWLSQIGGLKFSKLWVGNNKVFSTGEMEGVPPLLTKNSSPLPPGKVSPADFPCHIFIPPTKGSSPPNPLNSTFLLKIFF